jgi:hypothetical protein
MSLHRHHLYRSAWGGFAAAPPPPPDEIATLAELVAAVRAHAADGEFMTSSWNAAAPGGLLLPSQPVGGAIINVASAAEFQTQGNAVSERTIKLAPGDYPGFEVYLYAAQNGNRFDLTGCNITPPAGGTYPITVISPYGNCEFFADDREDMFLEGCIAANAYAGAPVENVWLTGLNMAGTFTNNGGSGPNGNDGCSMAVDGLVIQGTRIRAHSGPLSFGPLSRQIFVDDCELIHPNLHPSGTWYENGLRCNGADLTFVSRSRIVTFYGPSGANGLKHAQRQHASYSGPKQAGGRMVTWDTRWVGGGFMSQYVSTTGIDVPQSHFLSFRNVDIYATDTDTPGMSIPHVNTIWDPDFLGQTMNENLQVENMTLRSKVVTPGTEIFTSNVPPGQVTNALYAAHQAEPAWSYLDGTPGMTF